MGLLNLVRRRLVFKIAGISVATVCLTLAYWSYETSRRERWLNKARFGKGLQRIVQVGALSVDAADLRCVRAACPSEVQARARLRAFLRAIHDTGELGANPLRLLAAGPLVSATGGATARPSLPILVTWDGAGEGGVQPLRPEVRAALRRALGPNRSAYSSSFHDTRGVAVAAFAAVGEGREGPLGVLSAEYHYGEIMASRANIWDGVLLRSLIALALAVVLSAALAAGIGRRLRALREGAEAMEEERFRHRVPEESDDELGLVARQFNKMAGHLAEKAWLLKFLPTYTHDAIMRHTRGDQTVEAEAVRGTVMFTDIRGYTALSEGLEPARVVAMLNLYLRRQAEILTERGGVIDKFIGDAVLALFTGEDHAGRAVDAAQEIQRALVSMNAAGAFEVPVSVGLGLASGDLVLGEIGSDDRRERTLVGSVVNLASRLCSHAGRNELLVSDEVRRALGPDLQVEETVALELKGFTGPQRCHRVRAPS